MGQKFWFSSTPGGKVKNHILKESHKISQKESFGFWFQFLCGKVMLTARSFKEPNNKGISSALLQPKINRPKKQRFVWGDFMRLGFCQNVILNFSTRRRRKSKFPTHGVLNGNCHSTSFWYLFPNNGQHCIGVKTTENQKQGFCSTKIGLFCETRIFKTKIFECRRRWGGHREGIAGWKAVCSLHSVSLTFLRPARIIMYCLVLSISCVSRKLTMPHKPPAMMAACGCVLWGGETGKPRGWGGFKRV